MSRAVPGHVVPGTSTPIIKVLKPWGWQSFTLRAGNIVDEPNGPPIHPEPVSTPTPVAKPKQLGEEGHHGIMNALTALVQQHTTQMVDAMPSDRLWR